VYLNAHASSRTSFAKTFADVLMTVLEDLQAVLAHRPTGLHASLIHACVFR
jgi:hypothetical protein